MIYTPEQIKTIAEYSGHSLLNGLYDSYVESKEHYEDVKERGLGIWDLTISKSQVEENIKLCSLVLGDLLRENQELMEVFELNYLY